MKIAKIVLVLLGIFLVAVTYPTCSRSLTGEGLTYQSYHYEKHHVWEGIEVGVVLRQPEGSVIVRGRHHCIIAFPEGRREEAHILYTTALGEIPPPVKFLSAAGSLATYQTDQGQVTVDLSTWSTQPPLTSAAP